MAFTKFLHTKFHIHDQVPHLTTFFLSVLTQKTNKQHFKPTKPWLNKTCLSTSGAANPFVPRGLSPASVYSSGSLLAESKSASLALVYSSVNNTFLAEKQMDKQSASLQMTASHQTNVQ